MVTFNPRINALDSFGTVVKGKAETALRKANALFGLKKVSLSKFSGQKCNPDLYVVIRTDTGTAIGQVGNGYECMDNEEFFAPTAEALIDSGAMIDRFSMLGGGNRAFMRLSWPDDQNLSIGKPKVGDIIGRRALLHTSHDGKWAGRLSLQMLRLICSNGMTVPIGECDFALTHTKGGGQQLRDITKMMPTIVEYVRRFEIAANFLAETPILAKSAKCEEIVKAMADPGNKAKELKNGDANVAQQRVNRIIALFDGKQPGADKKACKGTGWGLYNAYVDSVTHGTEIAGDVTESRFRSLLPGGDGQRKIVRAWGVLTDGLGITEKLSAALRR